jgi:UDP-glucose 4-epimerase
VEIYGDGEQTRDYIFVEETVDAFVKIANEQQTRGKVINIATGKEITINKLVRNVLSALGVPNHPIIYSESRPGDVRRHCGSVLLAEKLVGFKSRGMQNEFLQRTIDWYLRKQN